MGIGKQDGRQGETERQTTMRRQYCRRSKRSQRGLSASANPQHTVLLIEHGPADPVCHSLPQILTALRLATKIQSVADLVTGCPVYIFQGNGLGGATVCSILVVRPVSMMDGNVMVRKCGVRKHNCPISLSRKRYGTRQIQEYMGRKRISFISVPSFNLDLPQENGATVIIPASSIPTSSCKSPRFGFALTIRSALLMQVKPWAFLVFRI